MHVNSCMYGFIWLYILIYAPFWHPKGAQDLFTAHSYPGSWCMLYQADTATVQCHPTIIQRAVALAQLPQQMVIYRNKAP